VAERVECPVHGEVQGAWTDHVRKEHADLPPALSSLPAPELLGALQGDPMPAKS
jgi:hypothetical protein